MPKLPSVFARRSCGSSKVTYLNRTRAVEQLRLLLRRLVERNPAVLEVRLFGSLARGDAVPRSDADLLIVLADHPLPRWFDRVPELREAFLDTDMPVEPFPYTQAELARLEATGTGLARAARQGIVLAAKC